MRCVAAAWIVSLLAAAFASAQAGPRLQVEREIVLRGGSSACVAWSPDGRWIASAGECGEVLVLSRESGPGTARSPCWRTACWCCAYTCDAVSLRTDL